MRSTYCVRVEHPLWGVGTVVGRTDEGVLLAVFDEDPEIVIYRQIHNEGDLCFLRSPAGLRGSYRLARRRRVAKVLRLVGGELADMGSESARHLGHASRSVGRALREFVTTMPYCLRYVRIGLAGLKSDRLEFRHAVKKYQAGRRFR